MEWLYVVIAIVPAVAAASWWYTVGATVEHSAREGIYAEIERLCASEPRPLEKAARLALEQRADREFRVALEERGVDSKGYRLELRDDELFEVAPWVVHADGRAEALSAFEASLNARSG